AGLLLPVTAITLAQVGVVLVVLSPRHPPPPTPLARRRTMVVGFSSPAVWERSHIPWRTAPLPVRGRHAPRTSVPVHV
ncbi:hypothetical protein ACWGL3_28055, partial [Nocardiopsis sp. NPDC055824]